MEIGFGSLVPILPEIILIIGGLLILLLDATAGKRSDSGAATWSIAVLFLLVGLVGVVLQLGAAAADRAVSWWTLIRLRCS